MSIAVILEVHIRHSFSYLISVNYMCRVCVEILSEIFKCKGIRCLCFHDSRKNPTNQIQLILDLCAVSVKVI